MPHMSTDNLPQDTGAIPTLTLGRRLHIAMEHGEISRERMAVEIGVDTATISRWTKNRFKRPPMRAALQHWARLCGVSESWLIDGQGDIPTPPAFPALVTQSEPLRSVGGKKPATRQNKAYCSTSSRTVRLGTPRAA